MEAIMTKYNHI